MLQTILLQAPAAPNTSNIWIMFLVMIAIFYVLIIRPNSKKQKAINQFRNSLMAGDQVVTGGGLYGKVKEIKDNHIIIEIANNVCVKVDKNSVFQDTTSANANTNAPETK